MNPITDKLILTAGPTISNKEIEYVTDAAINGWNDHHSDYIKKFEAEFAKYIGVKYAMATSSCTGALHVGLLALGIKPGDEVIVPETTWIATVSAVAYIGAVPVFADIDPETWVMDPQAVKKLLTPKTKAIIPVHLYGNPVDMEPLWELSKKYDIKIFEDAAPSIGAMYKGTKTGNLGDAAAFSFQGAKALVTGEGGMFVTNDDKLMARARFLNDHGRDPNSALCSIEIGYKYKMSNLQAALGLAQIERAEEIVAKKRQIFKWYSDRLSEIKELRLNIERSQTRNIYWMSTIVIDPSINVQRDEFMKLLKGRNIDSRPVFSPISSFPMFRHLKVSNPVAYDIPLRSINLPSGHERTEEEIDYICSHIKNLLGYNKEMQIHSSGWMAFRDSVSRRIRQIKTSSSDVLTKEIIPLHEKSFDGYFLEPVVNANTEDPQCIEQLSKWREIAQPWFPSQFKITIEGTKKWLINQVQNIDDRILFLIKNKSSKPLGHVGLFRFNYKAKSFELDNIIRGVEKEAPGIMQAACISLLDFTFKKLCFECAYLRVASDNERALKMYSNIGFEEIQRVPLQKVEENGNVRWIEVIGQPYIKISKYFVTMKLDRQDWENRCTKI